MNRSDMHSLARLVIVSIAAYLAISQFAVVFYLPFLLLTATGSISIRVYLPIALMMIAYLIAICLLMRYSHRIAQWLVGPVDDTDAPRQTPDATVWLPAAFRIACLLGGFVFLYRFSSTVASTLMILLQTGITGTTPKGLNLPYHTRPEIIMSWLLILAIGIYLLFGAPHFVRWHVKKTLELSAEKPDNTGNDVNGEIS